jgi:Predicted nucleotide-binding protein containing TIR-like domain
MANNALQPLDPRARFRARPIRVLVSYEWEKESEEKGAPVKSVRQHTRWRNISGCLKKIAGAVKTIADKSPGHHKLEIRISRLRGLHGTALLPTLVERIKRADVLVIDIGSNRSPNWANPNVLIELGMALAANDTDQRGLFVLKPDSCEWPSDLNGYLYTEYRTDPKEPDRLELLDYHGFDAALRSRLLEFARDREMMGPPSASEVDIDDDKELRE